MMRRAASSFLVGLLCAQLVLAGCAGSTRSSLGRIRGGQDLGETEILEAMTEDPDNASLLAMEQGFSLLRSGLPSETRARFAASLLEKAHASFEDLSDPANLNVAFSADEDKPYRGRPHERVLTALTLALMDMAQGRCEMAIPTLRSAEFLDARWQPFPYGTDAPLVYALMLRCDHLTQAAESDLERARNGLRLSVRMKLATEPMVELLHQAQFALPRGGSIPTRLAAILLELAIPAVLISRPEAQTAEDLVRAASGAGLSYLDRLDEALETEPMQGLLARVARLVPDLADKAKLKAMAHKLVAPELSRLDQAMRQLLVADLGEDGPGPVIAQALEKAAMLVARIEAEVVKPRAVIRLSGVGPSVEREGQYSEVAVIRPGEGGSERAQVRNREAAAPPPGCGLHASDGELVAVLCDSEARGSGEPQEGGEGAWRALELWSSSYQATSVVGRRFDKVLEGRAVFKSGAENVSVVAAWAGWFLFNVAGEIFKGCDSARGQAAQICLAIALVVLAAAVLSLAVAGTAWLAGAVVNPAADGRYVHSLFESGELLVAGGGEP